MIPLNFPKSCVLLIAAMGALIPVKNADAATLYWKGPNGNNVWEGGSARWATTAVGSPTNTWVNGSDATTVASNSLITIYSTPEVNILTVNDGLSIELFSNADRYLNVNGGGSGHLIVAGKPIGTLSGNTSLRLVMKGTSAWDGQLQADFSNGTTNTQISSGKTTTNYIVLNSDVATGTATQVFLNGGVLGLDTTLIGKTATIGELKGVAGSEIRMYNTSDGTRTLKVDQSTNTTYAGSILYSGTTTNVMAFTKDGAGRLRLTGDNTHRGANEVSEGSLYINGTTSNQGSYTVQNGATLGGTGTIGLAGGNSITVANGGVLDPGDLSDAGVASAGTMVISGGATAVGLNFVGDATIKFNLSTTLVDRDFINLTGSSMSGSASGGAGSIAFDFFDNGGGLAGNTFDLISFGMAPGITIDRFALSSQNITDGWNVDFAYSGNTLQATINVIPEPTTFVLALGGLLAMVLGSGRRSSRRVLNENS